MAARSCDNCIYRNECKKVGTVCEGHSTMQERINTLFRGNVQAMDRFVKEWEAARHKLRKLGGLE